MKFIFLIISLLLITGCSIVPAESGRIVNIDRCTDTTFIYTIETKEMMTNGSIWSSYTTIRFYSNKRFDIGDTVEFVKK